MRAPLLVALSLLLPWSASSLRRGAVVPAAGISAPPPRGRSLTDVIHRNVELHPLCCAIVDTPEFQRLRGVSQLGTCSLVFPCAVHDRFQHSLGVAHLAARLTGHLQARPVVVCCCCPHAPGRRFDAIIITLAALFF